MEWSKCEGSTCTGSASSTSGGEAASAPIDAAVQLQLETTTEADAASLAMQLQLSFEEFAAWVQRKDQLVEERQRIREQLKQRFDEFCERHGVGPWGGGGATVRWAAAY